MSESGLTKQTRLVIVIVCVILVVSAGVLVYSFSSTTGQSVGSTQTSVSSSLSAGHTSSIDTSKYLGYIPSGYVIAARSPNAPVFPCPAGMNTQQCELFQQTCGNSVCDPNETCQTCPIDCGASGAMVCDPYTGRPGAPASVCQVVIQEIANGQITLTTTTTIGSGNLTVTTTQSLNGNSTTTG